MILSDSCLPCGFVPYGVFPTTASYIPPKATNPRVTMPSQRFTRSQGFLPPAVCRPSFMPVPPLGFPLQGLKLTPGAIHSLELLSPLVVSSPYGLCFRCLDPRPLGYGRFPRDDPSRSNASFSSPHSRVFVPVSARPSGANFARKNATLLGFHLPKGFPLSPAGLPRSPFLS